MLALCEVKSDLQVCRRCHHANVSNRDGRNQLCMVCRGLPVTTGTQPFIVPPTQLNRWAYLPCFRLPRRMINFKTSGDQGFPESPVFTVLSYNLLADIYATQDRHRLCPLQALEWGYRSQNLVQEILGYRANIMCLQEVQSNHYMEFFLPMFSQYGYEGFYQKKNNKYTAIVDGCATFIRRDRLECVEQTIIEFGDLVKHVPAKLSSEPEKWNELAKRRFRKDNIAQVIEKWNELAKRRFRKDNIAQVMMLNFKSYGKKNSPDRRVCIANTHIHSQPANRDVKLWQVNYLLRTLKELVRKQESKVNDCIPLVLCGDFNSVPGSVVHSLLANGSVDPTHDDLKVDPCGVLQPTTMFHHNLPLANTYSSYNSHSPLMGCVGEPKSTTFACDFKGTLDYIFYSRTNLKVESPLELIGETVAGPNSSLPSYVWSSDHIALLAQLRWCSSSSFYRTSTATSDEINPDI